MEAQRRDSQGCRRGWNRQRSAAVAAEAGRSGGCMFGFAAVDYVAAKSLGSAGAAEVAAAGTAAVPSVDAVGGGCEEAAAIAIRIAVGVGERSGMIVVDAAAAVEEEVRMLDMAAVAEEEDQEEEVGNTARPELGSACRN